MLHEVKLLVAAAVSLDGLLVFDLSCVIDLDVRSRCGSTSASSFPVFGQHCDLHSSASHGFFFCVVVLFIMSPPAARPAAFDATLTELGVNK